MNRKGAYSGIIASIAIVAIIAVAFNSSAAVRRGAEQSYSKAIVDAKRDWQNARYLLDKSASDALADATTSTCNSVDTGQVNKYLNQTLNDVKANLKCNLPLIDIGLPDGNPSIDSINVTISVTISCGDSYIMYKKNATFEKTVRTSAGNPPCNVDVKDVDSTVCEVDTIPSSSANNLCKRLSSDTKKCGE